MLIGIESFKEKFKEYSDCYTVIGGAACDILMTEADFNFRATKDIDMILILEDRAEEFAAVFWEYIKEGNYRCGWKNNAGVHFYRFTEPKIGYPIQIELFSRMPEYNLSIPDGIIPDLRKHKNDVFRLLQIISIGTKIESSGLVNESIIKFLNEIESEDLRLKSMGLPFEKDEAIQLLREIYA